jgi:uncharacterized protein (DUF362 family)
MSNGITRRGFIKGGAALGASATIGGTLIGSLGGSASAAESAPAGLAAVNGPDGFANTMAAVEAVGGIARFVPSGSTVLINANTAFKHRGSIVEPNVLLATLELCAGAGAKRILLVKGSQDDYWKRCERADAKAALIDRAEVSERKFEVLEVEKGVALKEAHVDRHLRSADVYINLSIAKHHKGCDFTGALKNTMGACPHDPTCRFFHVGANPGSDDWYPDIGHLSQCIADLNTIRQPDLNIVDAGEILVTNGPFGPGKLANPKSVVASADMVAIDTYSARYVDLDPAAVPMIGKAAAHGLGTMDMAEIGVEEISLGAAAEAG